MQKLNLCESGSRRKVHEYAAIVAASISGSISSLPAELPFFILCGCECVYMHALSGARDHLFLQFIEGLAAPGAMAGLRLLKIHGGVVTSSAQIAHTHTPSTHVLSPWLNHLRRRGACIGRRLLEDLMAATAAAAHVPCCTTLFDRMVLSPVEKL